MIDRATQALFRIEVEVSRMVALNAGAASPEQTSWTLAHSCRIGILSPSAVLAYLIGDIVVLPVRAFYTLGSIEDWGLARAIHALSLLNTVHLVGGATQALPLVKVEVFGVEAFNAAVASPKLTHSALTLLRLLVIHSPQRAGCACPQIRVVVGWTFADRALGPIEIGLIGWAVHTHSLLNVVHHPRGTA